MQSSVLAIRKNITSLLTPLATRVYYERAPDDAATPYVVFLLTSSTPDGANTEIFVLEIDCWDDKDDQTPLETLVQEIINLLDKTLIVDGAIALHYELSNQFPIVDPDVRISRRKITFETRVIQRR